MVLSVMENPPFIFKASDLGDLIGKLGGFICESVRDGRGRSWVGFGGDFGEGGLLTGENEGRVSAGSLGRSRLARGSEPPAHSGWWM